MKAWKIALHDVAEAAPSTQLQEFITSLSSPKARTIENFVHGIEQFLKIANLTPTERLEFYGSQFLGLHYCEDLVKQLNEGLSAQLAPKSLCHYCISPWDTYGTEGTFGLIYQGETPSKALDKLIQGPTVIDCGLFSQLSIWFGLRNIFGNIVFDQLFNKNPIMLTQATYCAITKSYKPYFGNPLYPFFDSVLPDDSPSVFIEYIFNCPEYIYKHLGGGDRGHHCVVINKKYNIFSPTSTSKLDLKRSEVEAILWDSFNSPPDENDAARIEHFSSTPDHLNQGFYKQSHRTLLEKAKMVSSLQLRKEEWLARTKGYQPLSLKFNLSRLINWADQQLIPKTFYFSAFKNHLMKKQPALVVVSGEGAKNVSGPMLPQIKEELNSLNIRVEHLCDQDTTPTSSQLLSGKEIDVIILELNGDQEPINNTFLKECYEWYFSMPGKGLFILSKQQIKLEHCYGDQNGNTKLMPRFFSYCSDQYSNIYIHREAEINLTHRLNFRYLQTELQKEIERRHHQASSPSLKTKT